MKKDKPKKKIQKLKVKSTGKTRDTMKLFTLVSTTDTNL